MSIKRRVFGVLNYVKFIYFLSKGIFGSSSPEVALRVIQKFLTLEAPFYSNNMVMGRTVKRSIELLDVLITSYIETKSEITLNQIFEVLKTEFIEREKNGRK